MNEQLPTRRHYTEVISDAADLLAAGLEEPDDALKDAVLAVIVTLRVLADLERKTDA